MDNAFWTGFWVSIFVVSSFFLCETIRTKKTEYLYLVFLSIFAFWQPAVHEEFTIIGDELVTAVRYRDGREYLFCTNCYNNTYSHHLANRGTTHSPILFSQTCGHLPKALGYVRHFACRYRRIDNGFFCSYHE